MEKAEHSYAQYIEHIENRITEDLIITYSDCGIGKEDSVWDVLQRIHEHTEDKFLPESEKLDVL